MDDRITWLAPIHEHREHTADWYWAVGIVTVALGVAFIIVGNILLAIIVILGVGILLGLSRHEPKIVEYELSRKGIRTNKTLYPWETLESFWVLEETPKSSGKILLTSKKTLMPHIVIPIDTKRREEIHRALAHMLHEEHQVEPLPDRVMRVIGF